MSKASYKVDLSIVRGASDYRGTLTLKFDYKKANDQAVFLDGISKTLHKLTVNNKEVPVTEEVFKNNRIYFPSDQLAATNEVHVEYVTYALAPSYSVQVY